MSIVRCAVVLSLVLARTASAQPPGPVTPTAAPLPSVTLPPELARVLTDYEAAWKARDGRALAALFAEDGFVLSTGTPPVRGRANIERHYANAGGSGLKLRGLAYATSGDLGYIIGGYGYAAGEPDTGKFTLTLKRIGDRWLIFSDMDNGNTRRP
jgi:ketosteroid isomerase-like protein